MKKIPILNSISVITDTVSEYNGERPFLSTGNLNNSIIINTEYFEFNEKPSRASLNVKEGDIILARMQNTRKVKIITKDEENLIVSTGFIVLRKNNISFENYLYHFFNSNFFQNKKDKLCTGATQKAINNINFSKITIPLPPLPQQKAIAAQLDKAQELVQYNEQLIEKYDELQQSLFLDMFGDPVINEKGWEKKELNKFGNIKTGNTPSRNNEENYNEKAIEWIKTNNILETEIFVSIADEYLSKIGKEKGRIVKSGSLLVACIAGSIDSIGRSALTNREVAFNQQINAIEPNTKVNPKFLYYLFVNSKKYIQNHTTSGMKKMLSKGEFEKIRMILPPLSLQTEFASHIESIELQKEQAKEALAKSKDIFQGLLQEYFM